jgi:hypothetical protein
MDARAQHQGCEGEGGRKDQQGRQRGGEDERPVEQLLEGRTRHLAIDHRRQREVEHEDVEAVSGALLDVKQPGRHRTGQHQPEEGQRKIDDVGHARLPLFPAILLTGRLTPSSQFYRFR